MWVVIHENDGMKPKTQFYAKRALLTGSKVKYDGVKSDADMRPGDIDSRWIGTLVQEGVVLTESKTMAYAVARLATDYDIERVYVGEIPDLQPYDAELIDPVITAALEKLGKAGRPPPAQDWTVTCVECADTHLAIASTPLRCPGCGGLNISYRIGKREPFPTLQPRQHIRKYWLRSRFFTGAFEVPVCWDSEGTPAITPVTGPEKSTAEWVASGTIPQQHARIPEGRHAPSVLRFMDYAFLSKGYVPDVDRKKARLRAITEARTNVGMPPEFANVFEEECDIFSAMPQAFAIWPHYQGAW